MIQPQKVRVKPLSLKDNQAAKPLYMGIQAANTTVSRTIEHVSITHNTGALRKM